MKILPVDDVRLDEPGSTAVRNNVIGRYPSLRRIFLMHCGAACPILGLAEYQMNLRDCFASVNIDIILS